MGDAVGARVEDKLFGNWWAVLLRGLIAIGFAVLAWMRPGLTVGLLIIFFGAYALSDGVLALVEAGRLARRDQRWWPLALEGVLGIAIAVVTFLAPVGTARFVFILIGCWAIVTGVFEWVAAGRLRRVIRGEWLLIVSGLLRIAFGVLLFTRPNAGLHTLLWLMAAYALAYGVVLVALSFRLRSHFAGQRPTAGRMTPQPV
jgi:uncharacterized membrane protein HdeD (DUF308 family)